MFSQVATGVVDRCADKVFDILLFCYHVSSVQPLDLPAKVLKVKENTHLRAIRESILHVRMNDWLQLPKEGIWLDSVFGVFVNVLRNLWRAGVEIPCTEARSNWILDQVDVRGWAHRIDPENREEIIGSVRVGKINQLITFLPADVPPDIRKSYWQWVEEFVLTPVKELEPDLYTQIVNLKLSQISELANTDLTEGEEDAE